MKAQERGGLQDDRGTDQPVRPHEERTHASDDATGRRRLGARFRVRLRMSNCCLRSTDSATTDRAPPGPASWAICRQQMGEEGGEVARATILPRRQRAEILTI